MIGLRLLLLTMGMMLTGCQAKEDVNAQRLGQSVGETVTDFASGVGKGVDTRLAVKVDLSESVTELGLRKTVSKALGPDPASKKGISVYLLSEKEVVTQLVAKAFNTKRQEIGRAVVDAEFDADDAKYIIFKFDDELDTQLVDTYVIEARPPALNP